MALRSARFDAAQMASGARCPAGIKHFDDFPRRLYVCAGRLQTSTTQCRGCGRFQNRVVQHSDRDTAASGSASGACYDYAAWRWNVVHSAWGAEDPTLLRIQPHGGMPAGTWDQDEWISFSLALAIWQLAAQRALGRTPDQRATKEGDHHRGAFPARRWVPSCCHSRGTHASLRCTGGLGHIYHPTVGFGWSAKGGAHAQGVYAS